MDLDELLATKLVTFMMEHHGTIFLVPAKLRRQVEEHLSHLKRVQVCTKGEIDVCFSSHYPPPPATPFPVSTVSIANIMKIFHFPAVPTVK